MGTTQRTKTNGLLALEIGVRNRAFNVHGVLLLPLAHALALGAMGRP
jgi:hypothetical protein